MLSQIILFTLFYGLGNSNYEITTKGSLCSDTTKEIKSEAKCKEAATSLNLQWGLAWEGDNDFPACMYAQDSRNKVYFNLSPRPNRLNINPNYSAICNINSGKVIASIDNKLS